jgi:hypothetical protein
MILVASPGGSEYPDAVRFLDSLKLIPRTHNESAAPLTAQVPDWKAYSYPADGFSATYPSQPEIEKKEIPTPSGNFQLRSYLVQDASIALYIGVCDYGSAASIKDPDAVLQGAKNGALANSNSHLVSEKKIALGDNPGLEFEGASDAGHLSVRLYLVGATLYQTLVVSPPGSPYSGTARFLDSFQLIPRVSNQESPTPNSP